MYPNENPSMTVVLVLVLVLISFHSWLLDYLDTWLGSAVEDFFLFFCFSSFSLFINSFLSFPLFFLKQSTKKIKNTEYRMTLEIGRQTRKLKSTLLQPSPAQPTPSPLRLGLRGDRRRGRNLKGTVGNLNRWGKGSGFSVCIM